MLNFATDTKNFSKKYTLWIHNHKLQFYSTIVSYKNVFPSSAVLCNVSPAECAAEDNEDNILLIK